MSETREGKGKGGGGWESEGDDRGMRSVREKAEGGRGGKGGWGKEGDREGRGVVSWKKQFPPRLYLI